jgi:putative DNA primase/helicase
VLGETAFHDHLHKPRRRRRLGHQVASGSPGTKLRTKIKFDDVRNTETGKLGVGDIEIIQWFHRYAVVWPSLHPEMGGQYGWQFEGSGIFVPARDDERFAFAPERWIQGLRDSNSQNALGDIEMGSDGPYNVSEALTEGEPSRRVTERLTKAVTDLTGPSRFDTTRDHVLALLGLGKEGHTGVKTALKILCEAYVNTVEADRPGGRDAAIGEFKRFITNQRAGVLLSGPVLDGNGGFWRIGGGTGMEPIGTDAEAADTDAQHPEATVAATKVMLGTEDQHHRTQLGFARFFAKLYEGKLLYVHNMGWLYWDGKRWAADEVGEAARAVNAMLDKIWVEAKGNQELAKAVIKCENASSIDAILRLARTLKQFAITVGDLDADPYLLNCANGTLDLRTMELHDHDPADRITKVTRAAYHAGADNSLWTTFLVKVLPDKAVREYLQRVCGVALLGKVIEHNLAILKGSGNNGKTRLYQALLYALGDYGDMADPELFMERKGSSHLGEMALRGLRLAVVSESGKDRALDEARMKRLTGGDPINARFHYQNPITFTPSHLPLFITNHLPKVNGDDPAVWRRLRVVPFDVVITEAERDVKLDEKLQLAADAVLAWAIAGWTDYRTDERLREPAAVLKATKQYRDESDDVGRFLDDAEWVLKQPTLKATGNQLLEAYKQWAVQDGADDVSLKAFGKILDDKGFPVTKREANGRWREGLAVNPIRSSGGSGDDAGDDA